jgi:hypothetical protein
MIIPPEEKIKEELFNNEPVYEYPHVWLGINKGEDYRDVRTKIELRG